MSWPSPLKPLPELPAAQDKRGWPWTAPRFQRKTALPGLPRITVITPTLNQGTFLEATLRSVLLQGYPNLEYIVIDGGSTDQSLEILHRYSQHLSYWVSERDCGQAHAINKGLARSSGEVLGWLNSDDLLLPGSLLRIGRALAQHPEWMVVTGLRRVIDSGGAWHRNWVRHLPTPRNLRTYCSVAQETVYWRRSVYAWLGPLDESFHYALDYEYWLRMLAAGFAFQLLPSYLGAYREHPASKSATQHHVYHNEIARLARHHGVCRDEDDLLCRRGKAWLQGLTLLEDLGPTPVLDYPGATTALLQHLETPQTSRLLSLYQRYRRLRPRHGQKPRHSRFTALLRAAVGEWRQQTVEGILDPYLAPANPLGQPRWTCAEATLTPRQRLKIDGLAVGEGWSFVERSSAHVYRWADNHAEILVTRPSGRRRTLRLWLESGPSLGWQAFPLEVRSGAGELVLARTVASQDTLTLGLPLATTPTTDVHCFRLVVPSTDRPASVEDLRVLNFRLIDLSWQEDSRLYDLPLPGGFTLQIALEPDDITPPSAVQQLLAGKSRKEVPRDGLFIGHGWLAPARSLAGRRFRWAVGQSEIVVTGASRLRATLALHVAAEGEQTLGVRLLSAEGECVGQALLQGEAHIDFDLPLAVGATQIFTLELTGAAGGPNPASAVPCCQVFSLAWA